MSSLWRLEEITIMALNLHLFEPRDSQLILYELAEQRLSFCSEGARMNLEQQQTEQPPNFRLDVPLHDLLTKSSAIAPGLRPSGKPQAFPDPVFPQHPELLGPIDEAD